MKLLLYRTLCKKKNDLLFIRNPFFKLARRVKEEDKRAKRIRQKKAETKEKGGEKGRKINRKLKTREGKNRAAN